VIVTVGGSVTTAAKQATRTIPIVMSVVVDPVGSGRSARHLRRFSLRGRRKVNTQWLLYCLVHNVGKLQRYGLPKTV
jgi:Transposase DDE domain